MSNKEQIISSYSSLEIGNKVVYDSENFPLWLKYYINTNIIAFFVLMISAYISHIWFSIQTLLYVELTSMKVSLIISGMLFPPIGVINGINYWFM